MNSSKERHIKMKPYEQIVAPAFMSHKSTKAWGFLGPATKGCHWTSHHLGLLVPHGCAGVRRKHVVNQFPWQHLNCQESTLMLV